MPFIGVVRSNKNYEKIIAKFNARKELNLININPNDIENLRNVKFDMLIIDEDISKLFKKKECFNKIFDTIKYLIINADIENELNILKDKQINIISYGINPKATVTISSVSEDEVLIAIQRKIKDEMGKIIEEGELKINTSVYNENNIYDILVEQIIKMIYNDYK